MMKSPVRISCLATLLLPVAAGAKPLVVQATDNIYGAGQTSAPGGGTVPNGAIPLAAGDQCVRVTRVKGSLMCSAAKSCIVLNETSGDTPNDADGAGSATSSSSNTGAGSISGITAPNAGYLTGVFIPAGGPSGPAPAALDFTTGKGTTFKTIAPQIDQSFFIGDGHRQDGKGAVQTISVPAGAASLVLGISDACNYNGSPGCYDDNTGKYSVTYTVSATSCN